MKAMRKEDFESEVDYIYSIVEVLKDFTEPQLNALITLSLRANCNESDAETLYENYIFECMHQQFMQQVKEEMHEHVNCRCHIDLEEKTGSKQRPDKLWRDYDAE